MAKLFIICGHGAGDSGAVGNGYQEQERVRALASKIKLYGGNDVIVGDVSKNWYASGLISTYAFPSGVKILELHMDSGASSAKGGHVIIKGGLSADKYDNALAQLMKDIFPGRSSLVVGRNDLANPNRAARRNLNYRLCEFGFISNAEDVNKFNTRMDEIAKRVCAAFDIIPAEPQKPVIPTQKPGNPVNDCGLVYQAHVQNVGDLPKVRDGQVAGTEGFAMRLEGLRIDISDIKKKYPEAKLTAKAHIQDIGWVSYDDVTKDTVIGTTGKSLRLEAIELDLTGTDKKLQYCTHIQGAGWTPWVEGGFTTGTIGLYRRIEAIRIKLV